MFIYLLHWNNTFGNKLWFKVVSSYKRVFVFSYFKKNWDNQNNSLNIKTGKNNSNLLNGLENIYSYRSFNDKKAQLVFFHLLWYLIGVNRGETWVTTQSNAARSDDKEGFSSIENKKKKISATFFQKFCFWIFKVSLLCIWSKPDKFSFVQIDVSAVCQNLKTVSSNKPENL